MQSFFSALPCSRTLRQLGSIACAALLLAACSSSGGGGGGGTPPAASVTISGTAAAGAPVVGFVAVRDSSANPQPVRTNIPIEANGHYSVDVTGLTAPFAFLASGTVGGKAVSLYSAATQADVGRTINITPFTDLIIRNIAAGAVDAYINNGAFTGLTPAELDAQRVALTNQLAPALTAMGLSSSIDLLRATFNADSTGLDRFMDVVKVSTTPTGATITNILDAANQLILDTAGVPTSPPLGTGGLSSVDQIAQTFQQIAAFFATGLPDPANQALVALFSNTFLEDGENRSAFLTDITTDPTLIGLKISNLVVDSVDTTARTAQVHFTPQDAAGLCLAHDVVGCSLSWQMIENGIGSGVWQIAGNRRIARVSVRTHATRNICASNTNCQPVGTTTYATGLSLNINNEGLQSIGSAVVTGPGLPNGGVTLTAQVNFTWFAISNPLPSCQGCTTDFFTMTDQQIALVVPNSTYTVQLFDLSGTPISGATYTEVVPVPPVLNAALPTMAYPSITSGTQNLAGIPTATLTPSWNIPAGLFGDILSVFVFQTDLVGQNLQNLNVRADVRTNGTATSGTSTLVIPAPTTGGSWTNGGYSIHAWDQYTGVVSTHYQ